MRKILSGILGATLTAVVATAGVGVILYGIKNAAESSREYGKSWRGLATLNGITQREEDGREMLELAMPGGTKVRLELFDSQNITAKEKVKLIREKQKQTNKPLILRFPLSYERRDFLNRLRVVDTFTNKGQAPADLIKLVDEGYVEESALYRTGKVKRIGKDFNQTYLYLESPHGRYKMSITPSKDNDCKNLSEGAMVRFPMYQNGGQKLCFSKGSAPAHLVEVLEK